jgi:LPS export ABC transporter protein LptC/lipopolysaccharide transport protein LptA
MVPRRARQVRLAMLGVMAAVVVCVVLTMRHPPPTTPGGGLPDTKAGVLNKDWVVHPLKNGPDVELRAEQMASGEDKALDLTGVTLKFPYKAEGKSGIAQITSKKCLYSPGTQHADFSGEVKLRTPDGFELDTETLSYDSPQQIARTDSPFTFRRKEASGRGRGFVYKASEGTLRILADAQVQTEDEKRGTTEITSREAAYDRTRHTVLFIGDVKAHQGSDSLECGELLMDVDEQQHFVSHVGALKSAHLTLASQAPALGAAAESAPGVRELVGNKMDFYFRSDRTLEKLIHYKGELVLHPGAKERPEVRRVAADVLQFDFSAEGKLADVQGLANVNMVVEPVASAKVKPDPRLQRTLTCRRFSATVDPQSGQLERAEFVKDVVFASGVRRATAGHAVLVQTSPQSSVLTLTESPEVLDPEQGSRLSASVIDILPEVGDLNAREQVRHVISPRPGSKGRGPDSETVATCREFHYDAGRREAVYRTDALMRSASDELRAAEIRVFGPDGARKVHATGDVVSLLLPRNEKAKEKDPAPIDARAREMLWDESARRVDYTGDVVMRQRDMTTRSPKSIVYLNADGKDVDHIEAGEPVVVEQGKRSATGQHGVYHTATKTFTLVGPDVVVNDADGQSVHGRSLTFQMADDTIHVDGREEVRTETVLHRDRALP